MPYPGYIWDPCERSHKFVKLGQNVKTKFFIGTEGKLIMLHMLYFQLQKMQIAVICMCLTFIRLETVEIMVKFLKPRFSEVTCLN